MESSRFYDAFNELINEHSITILDSPELCKTEFKRLGASEQDVDVQLFFRLLDLNIPLEAKKITEKNENYSIFNLVVTIYANKFSHENFSNEYESILIRQIQLIVEVLLKENEIHLDYGIGKKEDNQSLDFCTALNVILKEYGVTILRNSEKLLSLLKDIRIKEPYDDIKEFIDKVNNQSFSNNKSDVYYFNQLEKALQNNKLDYEPVKKIHIALNVSKKSTTDDEEVLRKSEKESEFRAALENASLNALKKREKENRFRDFENCLFTVENQMDYLLENRMPLLDDIKRIKISAGHLLESNVEFRKEASYIRFKEKKNRLDRLYNKRKQSVQNSKRISVLIILVTVIIAFFYMLEQKSVKNNEQNIKTGDSSQSEVVNYITLYVSAVELNLREKPSAESKILAVLSQNEKVLVDDKKINSNWVQVIRDSDKMQGYVNRFYLSENITQVPNFVPTQSPSSVQSKQVQDDRTNENNNSVKPKLDLTTKKMKTED